MLWTVNVSPLHVRRGEIVSLLDTVLNETGMDPAQLGIELSEGGSLGESVETLRALEDLHSLGVKIIVDDFGTGFASLNYLRNFPVGGLKVDRTFTKDLDQPRTQIVIANTLQLARELDLWMVVEGVATEDHRCMLLDMGATLGQGYRFGGPKPTPRHLTQPRSDTQPDSPAKTL